MESLRLGTSQLGMSCVPQREHSFFLSWAIASRVLGVISLCVRLPCLLSPLEAMENQPVLCSCEDQFL